MVVMICIANYCSTRTWCPTCEEGAALGHGVRPVRGAALGHGVRPVRGAALGHGVRPVRGAALGHDVRLVRGCSTRTWCPTCEGV